MMQLHPIGSYLTRFDKIEVCAADALSWPESPAGDISELAAPLPPAPDIALIEAEAARNEIRAELEREFDKQIAKEREAFADRLAAERALWANEEGVRLAEGIQRTLDEHAHGLRDAIGRLLAPFVTHHVLERSLYDFMDFVLAAAADREHPLIHIQGPSDLLEVARQRLSQENIAIRVTQRETVDIAAQIGDTLIETRMEEWMRRLRNGE